MAYIEYMQAKAEQTFDALFEGVSTLYLADYPDHPNVGDSAIALGELAYFKKRSMRVLGTYCIGTFPSRLLESRTTVVIHGGGNVGGFFKKIDDHRYRIGKYLTPTTTLIQAPQSIHFVTPEARNRFADEFANRPGLRFGVRDVDAIARLEGLIDDPFLAPDAVHHLGQIKGPSPLAKTLVLARSDRESSSSRSIAGGLDWPKEHGAIKLASRIRWKGSWLGPFGGLVNPSTRRWETISNVRFQRGVEILSRGETIVTDRLHAMLISLQMGRKVVAIDNNNQKLSKYAAAWFGESQPDVQFVRNFDEAMKLVDVD
jgi:pyruvyl transferase EpsO